MNTRQDDRFRKTILGRTGLEVCRLGVASSYGVPARAIEEAFERGVNYLYWGSSRTEEMGNAIRSLARSHRDRMVLAIQSYARIGSLVEKSVEKGLGKLGLDHAEFLILGWFNHLPSRRVLDAAERVRERGLVRFIGISCHHRPSFQDYLRAGVFDLLMVRYNAAHRGAELEVFPHLPDRSERPGIVAYTTTRWGYLMSPRWVPRGERLPTAADCYRFALTNPSVDVCVTGPANAEQMSHALTALDRGPLDAEEMAWMKRVGDHIHARAPQVPMALGNLLHPFGAH